MYYIISGIAGFALLLLFDYFNLKNSGVKKIFGIAGISLLVFSGIMVIKESEKIPLPSILKVFCGILWVVSGFLLIYSLFLELPFVKTYGKDRYSSELVETGTYALCRHPGVLWFGLVFLFAFFSTGAILLIPAGIIWTGLDFLHVYIQEKLFFHKMFPDYARYSKTTPMLLPTGQSIKKCISTLKR